MLNKEQFDYSGITQFRNKCLAGKGIRIAVIEGQGGGIDPSLPFFNGKVHDPLGMGKLADRNDGALNYSSTPHASSHMENCVDVIHQVVPDAEIFCLGIDDLDKSFEWVVANDIHLINFSVTRLNIADSKHILNITDKTFICACAGNSGVYEENYPASTDKVCAVAACTIYNGTVERCAYSTKSNKLDLTNFAGLMINLEGGITNYFNGTSCASPYTVGMLALFMERFKAKFDYFPTIYETNQYILTHCKDLEQAGFDSNTGNGLFILDDDMKAYLWDGKKMIDRDEFLKQAEKHNTIAD